MGKTGKKISSALRISIYAFIFLNVFILQQVNAGSFTVAPMIVTIEPQKNDIQQWLTVTSNSDEPVAVELGVIMRQVDITGKVFHETTETDEKFLIYPSQLILFPGDVQMVSVQWLGEVVPEKELIYSLIAEQVAVNLDDDEGSAQSGAKLQMDLLIKYEGIVYVRPDKISPDVIVESATSEIDDDGVPHLVVMLYNQGSARQKINKIKLTVSPVSENRELPAKSTAYMPEMPQELIRQSLYAEQRRRCTLPWPKGVPVGPIQVTVECK